MKTSSSDAWWVVSSVGVAPRSASVARSAGTARWASRTVRRHLPPSRVTPSTLGSAARTLVRERAGDPFVHRELHHVLGPERGHQLPRRSESDDPAVIQDGHAVTEAFGLLHVVGGEEHRPPPR